MPKSPPNAAFRGFSMVELMVAMLIGLLGTIIIFQVFEVSEGIKRTTTSGGDTQQNGAIAMYVIERDLRSAGMGYNDTQLAGCDIRAYDSKRSTPDIPAGTMKLVPVRISRPLPTDPDQFMVLYSSQTLVSNAITLTANMASPIVPVRVMNPYGYRPGDLIVLLQPGQDCSLMEVTSLPVSDQLNHEAAVMYDIGSGASVTSVPARFNKPGALGLGVTYGGTSTANVARVYNLGSVHEPIGGAPNLPVYNTYRIDTDRTSKTFNSLLVSSEFVLDAAGRPVVNAVADNIVHMRVLYGVDEGPYDANGNGDGVVDSFIDYAAFNVKVFNGIPAPSWRYVLAVRVAIVARSALAEKKASRATTWPNCDTTTDGSEAATPALPDNRPKWSGVTFDVSASGDLDVTSPLSWRCYRYRVFETTIPLRNWIWKAS